MNERIHLPPNYSDVPKGKSLVFLAGPIQGSPDWQTETAIKMTNYIDDLHVASPRRIEEGKDFDYKQQVTWEKAHLRRSRELGVIMFWFASQDMALEYEAGRSYAQTTRIEIGRAFGWHDAKPFPLVIGFDPQYTENGGGSERYIRAMAQESQIPVLDSLEDTIDQVLMAA